MIGSDAAGVGHAAQWGADPSGGRPPLRKQRSLIEHLFDSLLYVWAQS
jgi:hypothetical protein